ncbi:hypothetical protein KVT40_004826 [Elsinoe batatas]|uniref:Uncharacterized protein n=1 Tax=Elsinoe batatas TaxID=2601811 RepID=A0A8K0PHD6_9PEZI|nr:hypothetical protein KVT40_004826 [Elsinoe batatas]
MEAYRINTSHADPSKKDLEGQSPVSFVQDEIIPYFLTAVSYLKDCILEDSGSDPSPSEAFREELQYLSTSALALEGSIDEEAFAFLQKFTDLAISMPEIWTSKKANRDKVLGRRQSNWQTFDAGKTARKAARMTSKSKAPPQIARKETVAVKEAVAPQALPADREPLVIRMVSTNERAPVLPDTTAQPASSETDYYSSQTGKFTTTGEEDIEMGEAEEAASSDYVPDGVVPIAPQPDRTYFREGAPPGAPRRLGRWESAIVYDQYGNRYLARPLP